MSHFLDGRLELYRGFPVVELKGDLDISSLNWLEQVRCQIEFSPLIIVDLTKIEFFDSILAKWLISWR